ncbi:Wzy polymerase domain-containing protein [Serratia rubidaea]|uniref:O-antigen ligase C-terminal domain-containing protein n=1 Tax=Serratia rubidaea TaxID=61652 RepID=A0ABS0MDL1_SERRU|nr:O-antigen ligase family protein [Serratia rubidaea]MBH1930450.1 O-antigen ligase C-terminal domain-containing protein [Serratia rubidaea]MDC6117550.1 Wzy polymerase domain-containing protein [Serratia rubidaea]
MLNTANIVIIFALSLLMIVFWRARCSQRPLIITSASGFFISGGALLALPLLYTPSVWLPHAAWRFAGLATGLLFLFSCLQGKYTRRRLNILLGIILLIIGIQAAAALLQLFMPDGGVPLYGKRVYGFFFQPNLLASFVATGLALALMLMVLPAFALPRFEPLRQGMLLLVLVVFSALLVCIQSRVGWLGGVTVAILFLWRFARHFPRHCLWAGAALLVGALLGMGGLLPEHALIATVNHDASNLARWTMLQDTLRMIAAKPWSGWGYGSFEYSFQHFRINQAVPTAVTEIARHPHNEILLWLIEGGIVALPGVILVVLGGVTVVRQAWRYDRQAFDRSRWSAGVPGALCIALFPMALHTQLEFPFYLSAQHFIVFLLLLALADRVSSDSMCRRCLPPRSQRAARTVMPLLAVGVALVMGFTFKAQRAIAQAERFGMEDITPLKSLPAASRWTLQERIAFDEHLNLLLTYNHTQDETLLDAYRQWASGYLARRVDKNVYASLIQILQHRGDSAQAERYRCDAARLFPKDARFQPSTPLLSVHDKESL